MYKEEVKRIEDWFITLNTTEFDGTDAGMVRDEMAIFLVDFYKERLGIVANCTKEVTE